MAISNCARCGRMYQKTLGLRCCQDCLQAEEDSFRTVRDYLEANPGADMGVVAEATEVDEAMILRFLRDGRLATIAEAAINLKVACVRCGLPIGGGKYCIKCLETMGQAFHDSKQAMAADSSARGDHEKSSGLTRRAETVEEKRRGDSSSSRDRR